MMSAKRPERVTNPAFEMKRRNPHDVHSTFFECAF